MDNLDRYGGYPKISSKATEVFRVEKVKGRWWFIDPNGNVFLSLGLNHIDCNALKYPENVHIWRQKYKWDIKTWIKEGVAKDLKSWGFNTIGWTQEVTKMVKHSPSRRVESVHSPGWRIIEYRWAGMPYCHLLKFANLARWNREVHYPDVFSDDFEEWCDFVARESCVDMADDPLLIGYFYSDVPGWTGHPWGHSWADDLDLRTEERREALKDIARRYYKVLHDSIRRYDKNHLILGDRYDGNRDIPGFILEIAKETIDVLSIQYFPHTRSFEDMKEKFARWHKLTGKPTLLADTGFIAPTKLRPVVKGPIKTQAERGKAYKDLAENMFSEPYFIGLHWCAYIENRARRNGLKNDLDEPYEDAVERIREFNQRVYQVVERAISSTSE